MGLARLVEDYAKEKGLIPTNEELSIFLVTDRQQLKTAGTELYPGKIMTTQVVPMHIAYDHVEVEVRRIAMMGTVVDWWIFSRCRFFLLESYSSFGRTAAAYSLRFNSTYDRTPPDKVDLKSMDAFTKNAAGLRALQQSLKQRN